MGRRVMEIIARSTLLFLILSGTAAAVETSDRTPYNDLSPLTLLTFLLPAGLILLSAAGLPEDRAVEAAAGAVITWGFACLAYFIVGFAFQFGGIAIVHHTPDLAELYWEYSPLDVAWGTGWGMMGLRGFFMAGPAATPGALTLFLAQLPLLGVATLIVHFAAWETARRWLMMPLGLLMGSIVYPLVGNWIWGGGWLANLGLTMAYGHGLVDAAGGGQVALSGAIGALAVISVFRGEKTTVPMQIKLDAPMPRAHLPLLGWSGALLMAIGWMATSTMIHFPPAVNVVPAVMAVNIALAAFGATFTAGLYIWFVSGQLDVLMMGRALTAGLVVMAAGAPFVPTWGALAAGLLSGLLLPGLLFLFEHRLQLGNASAALAIFGVPAILGLLWPGLLADGRYGAGWNRVGTDVYLGVSGQGVSGAWPTVGMTPDWPGQMLAQVIGIAAIIIWCFVLLWVPLRILRGIALAWRHSGIEFGTPPPPVPFEEEAASPAEVEYISAADSATRQSGSGHTDTLTDGINGH
jgi:Amt family ammonium transporter